MVKLLPLAHHLAARERRLLGALLALLAGALGVAAADALVGVGDAAFEGPVRYWAPSAGYLLVVAIVSLRALRVPSSRGPWTLIAAGLGLYAAGNLLWALWLAHVPSPPSPSVCDALWLSLYPIAYLALSLLARHGRGGGIVATAWIEGLVAGSVTAAIAAQLVFPMQQDSGEFVAVITNLAYPIADLLLVALVCGVLAGRDWVLSRKWALLGSGFLALCAADIVYLMSVAEGSLDASAPANLLYLGGVTLLAIAAWHPEAPGRAARAPRRVTRLIPQAFAGLALALLAVDHFHRLDRVSYGLAVVALIGALADVARLDLASRRLERAKDDLINAVSHEFRTPLTSIRGHLGLLRGDELTSAQERSVEVIERGAGRLLRLVDDLLFIGQLDRGRLALDNRRVDLGALASQCLDAARPAAQARSIELALDVRDPQPEVAGDAGRLAEVLDNLLSNAIKFSEPDGTVMVCIERRGDTLRVEVADSGIGIPAAEAERLFGRFERASSAVQRAIPGSGLGLYISRRIVEAHRGTIGIDSARPRGTTVWVALPAGGPS
jgi:signal transduction histidine kinase